MQTLMRLFSWLLVLSVTLMIAGCNIVGPAYLLVHGPPKTHAVYELDPERTTVIFIDDPTPVIPSRALRVLMAEEAENDMLTREIVIDMVSYKSAMNAAVQEQSSKPKSIQQIGQEVGADVVIYVLVSNFSLSSDGATYAPSATMHIKVFDIATGTRLWPDEPPTGFVATATLRAGASVMPSQGSQTGQDYQDLAKEAGLTVARLFYDYERPSNFGKSISE